MVKNLTYIIWERTWDRVNIWKKSGSEFLKTNVRHQIIWSMKFSVHLPLPYRKNIFEMNDNFNKKEEKNSERKPKSLSSWPGVGKGVLDRIGKC